MSKTSKSQRSVPSKKVANKFVLGFLGLAVTAAVATTSAASALNGQDGMGYGGNGNGNSVNVDLGDIIINGSNNVINIVFNIFTQP